MMSQPASACTSACLHQHRDGLVVEDLAVAHQAVMAVAGVGVERHVAEDADLRHLLLDRADRAADEVVRVERLAAVLVAQLRIGVGKQREAGDVELRPRARPRAPPRRPSSRSTPGIEATGARVLLAVDDEQRPDQVVGGEHVLAHQPPRPFGAAVAAQAGGEVERRRGCAPRPRPGRRGRGLRSGGRI